MAEKHLSKQEAPEVIKYMKDVLKLEVAMITGDNKHTAVKVAQHLKIPLENVTYRAYPNDKKATVQKFQENGHKVMFVGDGVNDSPVLAQADVGVAINAASDITVNAAGIIVMKDKLDDVVNAIRIARATFTRIKLNFGWAFFYNVSLVPIAMGVLYPIGYSSEEGNEQAGLQMDPMWAGAAMALSSCSVVLSSLFLKRFKAMRFETKETSTQKTV
jgi:Cu+-exporting ATPase